MKEMKQSVFVSGIFTSQADTVASQYDPPGWNPISVVYVKDLWSPRTSSFRIATHKINLKSLQVIAKLN